MIADDGVYGRADTVSKVVSPAATLAVLLGVTLRAQSQIDPSASAEKYLLEWGTEIAIEARVNDGVKETIGVTEPQEEAAEPVWYTGVRIAAERLYQSQYKEREPAGGKSSHDHT